MKKVLIILLNFMCLTNICAIDTNVAGVIVEPSKSTSVNDDSCSTGEYYRAGQDEHLLGLRVTFYDKDGTQVGNTIDVWNQNITSNKTMVSFTDESILAEKNGYSLNKIKMNHANAKPSRIDYYNGVKFELTGSDYYYYLDSKATGNALFYTKDAAAAMKEYFTTPEVVQRYMNITGANEKLNIYQEDYDIVLETLIIVGACGNGKFGGVYTVADFGGLVKKHPSINNFTLRCRAVKYLSLEEDGNVGSITFKKPELTLKKCGYQSGNYTSEEVTTSNLGVGMGFISGVEVCKENCSKKRYPIIYRPFDLSNPFLNKDGSIRDLSEKSNWYNKTDTIDKDIYNKEPFLTVILNPNTIREIRKDNENINYSKLNKNTCIKFRNDFQSIFNPNIDFCNKL